jgi:hypothetical protein
MLMPRFSAQLRKCKCGGAPVVRNSQVAEDCVETWAECSSCGRHTDYMEGAYSEPEMAVWAWNASETFEAKA